MTVPTTIPRAVHPEAAARVAQLGMQAELERMLEHAQQTISGLQRIDVWLQPPYDTGDGAGVIIDVYQSEPYRPDDPTRNQWRDWFLETFSPDVGRHFTMLLNHGADHAG